MQRYLILISLCLFFFVHSKAQNDRFYSPSEGLSGTSFHGIFQDSKGYIWISLFSNFNRFDGYSFKMYDHQPNDSTSISSESTNVVFEDSGKRLWIGAVNGLNQYDYQKDCFRHYRLHVNSTEVVLNVKWIFEGSNKLLWLVTSHGLVNFNPSDNTYVFYNHRYQSNGMPTVSGYNQAIADKNDNIWIGTDEDGVLIFDTHKHQFFSISEFTGIKYTFPDRSVMTIHQTRTGEILFGTAHAGIVVFDPINRSFRQTANSVDQTNTLDRGIFSIITDKKGTIWIGTEGNGVKIYDLKTNSLSDANHLIDIPGASKSKIICYEDKQGDMWFGIQERGIYLKIFSSKKFHAIGNSKKGQQISHYLVSSVLIDKGGNFWISTEGGGINLRRKGENEFKIFNKTMSGAVITDKTITRLFEDQRGWIWIGTYYEGFYCFQGQNRPILHYNIPGYEKESRNNYVFDFCEDSRGNIWVGSNGRGLFYLDVSKETLTDSGNPIVAGKSELIKPYINALEYDRDSALWIATANGLYSWNWKKDTFRLFQTTTGDLTNDLVTCLKKDNEGNMWIGTLSGLYRYNSEKSKLQRYSTDDGICSNSIKAIEFDKENKLWISTTAGISKFDTKTGVFTNYFEADGLPCDKYIMGSSYKDLKGNIYFGGVDGLVYFHPDSIVDDLDNPNLIFSSFKIFNQEITYNAQNPKNILQKDINSSDTVIIDYSSKSFTIEFAAINFSAPEKIKYAVQMDGFDPNWQYKDYKHRYATYTNLSPGTYFFNAKSTNLQGLWPGSQRKICIIVKPPFWMTWYAFIFYIALIILAVYYIRRIAIYRISMKNQLHLEHVELEKLEEMSRAKMQFFTNISHEIRTPLTMVLAPLERLMAADPSETQKKSLNYIHRNTKRIERIVNQLLELQKIENAQLKLKACEIELVKFLREVISLFEETADNQNIQLSFEPSCDELLVWVDPEKLDKIIFNLISNALKFTNEGGLITIKLNINQGKNYSISVSDTGKGMDQSHLKRIFDRFYQIEDKENGKTIGTGIGLHLSKQLVEKLYGKIEVTSKEGFGSTFTVILPLGKNHLSAEEIIQDQPEKAGYVHIEKPDPKSTQSPDLIAQAEDTDKMFILLVEDDQDILNYLEDELSVDYRILKASNGIDGWKLAYERTPDLIVSDIMMPGMDGLELCKKIKTTIETSHIPVILLTAKTTLEQEIEGLETGADEYMHKPFHPRILKLKVDKIVEAREASKQQFSKNTSFVAKEMTVTSADEKFLQKAIDFVKENLENADLSIEQMSIALSISRVHLYRKLKAITNQNPTEFIRTIRLKQAAYLLSQGKLNVSEIAYMVGFNSHQYFTNSFQKYFNMSPTEYSRKVN